MSMVDGASDRIEKAFEEAEADVQTALEAAKRVVAALTRSKTAARQGKIRTLIAAIEAAEQSAATLDQEIANLSECWNFDEESHLRSGAFSKELIEHGRQVGLRISELDSRLYCYPALIRVLPDERSIQIDKTKQLSLRPTVLTAELLRLQKRPARFRPAAFLEALYAAYKVATERKQKRTIGTVVPLPEIYNLLTMLPGQARDYSREEFTRDIYLLDQSGQDTTKDGSRIEFHAGAGAKLAKGTLSIVTQHGTERKYHGISFIRGAEE